LIRSWLNTSCDMLKNTEKAIPKGPERIVFFKDNI
jgi:hypothetical protein